MTKCTTISDPKPQDSRQQNADANEVRAQRREFLTTGLATLCAAAGGAAAVTLGASSSARSESERPAATRGQSMCGGGLPVLSTDGTLLDPITREPIERAPNYATGDGKSAVRQGIPNRKWVMVIDLAECDGCEKCTSICSKHHNLTPERQWIRVFKMEAVPGKTAHWFPKPCFHCDDPPCTRVCPVDATFKRQDGIVLIDNERCIGCRFCMAACPYSTRTFNWGKPPAAPEAADYSPERSVPKRIGTVEKCDFCPDMLRQGRLPHCVSSCKMGALMFGDENEDAVTNYKGETFRLSQLLQEKGGYRYLEDLGTQPRVYYLPPKNPTYDPPNLDKG